MINLSDIRENLSKWCYHSYRLDYDDAEDVVQDTMIKITSNLHTCRGLRYGEISAWTKAILRNTLYDFLRSSDRTPSTISMDSEGFFESFYDEDDYPLIDNCPSEAMVELIEIINNKVTAINAESLMMYVQGYRYDEIAEELDMPVGTIKSRVYRARNEIMKELK